MKRTIRRFLESCDGATAVEYALIGVLISLAIVAGATSVGRSVSNQFNTVGSGFSSSS